MPKEHFNPPDLFPSLQYGFSQVVTATPGRMIFVSGQVAWDAGQELVGRGDLKAQTRQALRNVESALDAVGAALADVVSMRLYIVDYPSQQAQQIIEAIEEVFGDAPRPACTWIGVDALADDGFLIEIEAMAVVDDPAALA